MILVVRFPQPRCVFAVLLAAVGFLPQIAGLNVAASDATRPQGGSHGTARIGTHASRPHLQLQQQAALHAPSEVGNPTKGIAAPKSRSRSAMWVQDVVFWCTLVLAGLTTFAAYAKMFQAKYQPHPDHLKAYLTVGEDDDDAKASDADDDKEKGVESASGSVPKVPGADSMGSLTASKTFLASGHVTLSTDELIDEVGLSGMSILPADETCGISKMKNKYIVPLIAVQAACLQVGMLHFLATQLVPRGELHLRFHELPTSIVFIAIYLHFLNCTQEIPYSWQIFQHFHDFHDKNSDLIVMGGVLILDAFVVPLLSFSLGALYLCTSRTISDVILNAVAVAFVHEIDNWILALNTRANFVAGKVLGHTVHIPINKKAMRKFSWTMIYVPVVPCLASAWFLFVGFRFLGL